MTELNLSIAADALRRASPDNWAKFVAAFKSYTDNRRDELVQSPALTLQISQGRAQQCALLLKDFMECEKAAAVLEKKSK